MQLYSMALTERWAMTEEATRLVLEILSREHAPDIAALEARLGRPLDNSAATTIREGVATIPIHGVIARRANLFTQVSGATSIELLARDLEIALNNAAVRAIILDIDSPGGSINGIQEMAAMIAAGTQRKPIVAYAGHLAASAGYWLASAATEIVINPTASLGSIGVVAAMPNPAMRPARDLEFVSSQSPRKRPDLTTEGGRSQIQEELDALADVFIADVASYRGVTADRVVTDFGEGGIIIGATAVQRGMADRFGTYEQLLAELSRPDTYRPMRRRAPRATALAHQDITTMKISELFGRLAKTAEAEEARVTAPAAESATTIALEPPATGTQIDSTVVIGENATTLPVIPDTTAADLAAAQAQIAALTDALAEQNALRHVSVLIEQGRLVPAQRDEAMKLLKNTHNTPLFNDLTALLSALPVHAVAQTSQPVHVLGDDAERLTKADADRAATIRQSLEATAAGREVLRRRHEGERE